MSNQLEITMKLIEKNMKFRGGAESKEEITTNYLIDGVPSEHTPLEVFLVSLSACSGGTVSAFLSNSQKKIKSLKVQARGIRRTEHPTGFEKIFLKFILESENTSDLELENIIKVAGEKYCPVWLMIKNSVEIEAEFQIIRGEN